MSYDEILQKNFSLKIDFGQKSVNMLIEPHVYMAE